RGRTIFQKQQQITGHRNPPPYRSPAQEKIPDILRNPVRSLEHIERVPKAAIPTLYSGEISMRSNPPCSASRGQFQEDRIEPRKPVEAHVKVDMGKAVSGELTRALDLSQQFGAQLIDV